MAFALTAIVGLLPVGMTAILESRSSLDAMRTATDVMADIREATPISGGVFTSPRFDIPFDSQQASAQTAAAKDSNQKVEVEFITRPGTTGTENGLYEVIVKVVWGLPETVAVPAGYGRFVKLYGVVEK